ncbi:hypothetical protein NQ318_006735 [Aromia moschata]|uniref:Uncharacterized protein n=1 Tax=Aromia moschata TaxID=1265417 RepID=A0AAV8YCP8_9CUCU|nr:hypothetical protein NQ318_006735 [Aromia moschata]
MFHWKLSLHPLRKQDQRKEQSVPTPVPYGSVVPGRAQYPVSPHATNSQIHPKSRSISASARGVELFSETRDGDDLSRLEVPHREEPLPGFAPFDFDAARQFPVRQAASGGRYVQIKAAGAVLHQRAGVATPPAFLDSAFCFKFDTVPAAGVAGGRYGGWGPDGRLNFMVLCLSFEFRIEDGNNYKNRRERARGGGRESLGGEREVEGGKEAEGCGKREERRKKKKKKGEKNGRMRFKNE